MTNNKLLKPDKRNFVTRNYEFCKIEKKNQLSTCVQIEALRTIPRKLDTD